jgi:RNA polymerase sigma-70 factor (ECF subfamily)
MTDWNVILQGNGPMVWRTAWRLLGNSEDAQDCLQETFLAAVKLSRRELVRSWPGLLRRLATNRALDMLRSRKRRRRTSAAGDLSLRKGYPEHFESVQTVPDPGPDPVQLAEAADLADRLRDALTQLPPREAQVFALRYLDEMSYGEIGDALDLKTNAVGVLLHQARGRLRGLMGDEREGTNDE